ncbi:MAG: threonine synthase [bacterium]
MNYYSLNRTSPLADFRQATLSGQAPDKGLYYPEKIPLWDNKFIADLRKLDKVTIGYEIMKPYVGNCISDNELYDIIKDTLSFDFPLKKINDNIFCLELFHGPTLAFKDLGARFLSRCMGKFSKDQDEKIVVLVATSGDTGGAVADAFYKIKGTEVIILYPSGKVSPVQEKQLTGLGENIHALEIQGDFDDCQRLVKTAFADKEMHKDCLLTSSNSINISRWLSQQIYYVLAVAQWNEDIPPVFSVPSGNFGNICAGLIAQHSGMPAKYFIAACNSNKAFPDYIETGNYKPRPSVQTISNAMDVGDPSNFIRIVELFQGDFSNIKSHVSSLSVTDEETRTSIKEVYEHYQYIIDPHTAIAYKSMHDRVEKNDHEKGIILGTAHPVKFPTVVEEIIQQEIAIPTALEEIMKKPKKSILLTPAYEQVKATIRAIISA